jgi:hypothetical protein
MRFMHQILTLVLLLIGTFGSLAQQNSAIAPEKKIMEIEALNAAEAMNAATAWISDFSKHGGINVLTLGVFPANPQTGKAIARIEYTEAK